MNDQPTEGYAEQVNEELRGYEGFPAILSSFRRTTSDIRDVVAGDERAAERLRGVLSRTPDEERKAQEAAYQTLAAQPEVADIVKRLADLDDQRRARASTGLFTSPKPEDVS